MGLALQYLVHLLQSEYARSFYQYSFVCEMDMRKLLLEIIHRTEELQFCFPWLPFKRRSVPWYDRTNSYEPVNFMLVNRFWNVGVQVFLAPSAFKEICQDHGTPGMLILLCKKIKRNLQWAEVGTITVVDNRSVIDSVSEIKAHCHCMNALHFSFNLFRGYLQVQ